jgi:hypothetical protein
VEFRKRFVAALSPQHLPKAWSIYHDAPREFGPHSIFSPSPDLSVTPSNRLKAGPRPVFAPCAQPAASSGHHTGTAVPEVQEQCDSDQLRDDESVGKR